LSEYRLKGETKPTKLYKIDKKLAEKEGIMGVITKSVLAYSLLSHRADIRAGCPGRMQGACSEEERKICQAGEVTDYGG
jgi:hypothetical protein